MEIKHIFGTWIFLFFLPCTQSHLAKQGDHKEYVLSKDTSFWAQSDARTKRASGNKVFENPWIKTDWDELGRKRILDSIKTVEKMKNTKLAKNVILFIGDGMGLPTVSAARVYKSQKENLKKEDMYLSWENFPHSSLSRTYNVDRIAADSAGTGTAYMSGIKANLGTIGVTENVKYKVCEHMEGNEIKSILHKSIEKGKSTGFVTTTRVTHASPAATFASTPSRWWEEQVPDGSEECSDIASQLMRHARNQDIRVIFGGGAAKFLPYDVRADDEGGMGERKDGQNLIKIWQEKKKAKNATYSVLRNKHDLADLNTKETDYVLGLFGKDNMNYETDRNPEKEPDLAEMTSKAIEVLRKNKEGYFLFVEGGRIDHAHHATLGHKAMEDTLAFDRAVAKAMEMVDVEDTLVVVSADHSHTFTVSGYASFEESIMGFADEVLSGIKDGKRALQMTYANGPGAEYHRFVKQADKYVVRPRKDLIKDKVDIYHKEFMQDAAVWTDSALHGAEDVGIYATGPWSHLFRTTEEQSYIAHVMMYASCVGQYTDEDHCTKAASNASLNSSSFAWAFSILVALFYAKF